MFVVKLPNPTQSSDEVIDIVMVLIWVITLLISNCSRPYWIGLALTYFPHFDPSLISTGSSKLLLLTRFAI
jgi:hypothetical protein